MALPFLLEIGVEEIPDWMIVPALKDIEDLFRAVLDQNKLDAHSIHTDATPRRLVLRAHGIPERQQDREELLTGPAKGAPAKALEGFARKAGILAEQLAVTTTPKGEYYTYSKKVSGRAAADILGEAIPGIIGRIYFPKTMYWTGKGGPRFIRPIRWIVALLGEQVIPCEFAGVKSGKVTQGHRVLGGSATVTVSNYEDQLRKNSVILSSQQRRQIISDSLTNGVRRDDALLETLVYLTECPSTIRGSFDKQYLELPQEILTTVMRHHQRYFSVEDSDGRLSNEFVAVMNTSADPDGLVRMGNERVLRARFNDARFFWDVDLRRGLEERVEDLKNVTFQAKLGSYFEKTERNAALAETIAKKIGRNPKSASRAALLAKCDLTTEMVKEFTELQGVVGGLYAKQQGEPEEVWKAIYEQYRPTSMDDDIPSTETGRVVSLADKLDTLQKCFAIGMVPTGSKDPFALRRAAQGAVRIIIEGRVHVPMSFLTGGNKELEEFFIDRLRYYFKDVRGFRYDEVNAVLASGYENLLNVASRLTALREVRPTENFEPLAASFKRIQNILRQAEARPSASIEAALLEAGPEADLYAEFLKLRELVNQKRIVEDYQGALEAIASLRPKVDLFFDKVLVNAPDEKIRQNRLTLLSSLLTEFSSIADFSEIVTGVNP